MSLGKQEGRGFCLSANIAGKTKEKTRGTKAGTAAELSGPEVRRAFLMKLARDKARAGMAGASELRVARLRGRV